MEKSISIRSFDINHDFEQVQQLAFSLRGIFPEYIGDGNDMVWLDIDLRKRL